MNLFERVVSAKGGGRETLRLSETQIEAVVVVLLAVPANGFTVKVTSEVVAGQLPLAATL